MLVLPFDRINFSLVLIEVSWITRFPVYGFDNVNNAKIGIADKPDNANPSWEGAYSDNFFKSKHRPENNQFSNI